MAIDRKGMWVDIVERDRQASLKQHRAIAAARRGVMESMMKAEARARQEIREHADVVDQDPGGVNRQPDESEAFSLPSFDLHRVRKVGTLAAQAMRDVDHQKEAERSAWLESLTPLQRAQHSLAKPQRQAQIALGLTVFALASSVLAILLVFLR